MEDGGRNDDISVQANKTQKELRMSNALMAYSGMQYTQTRSDDVSVLKTAHLLWDELQFIVPYHEFKLRSESNDPLVDEAHELIGKPHVPTESEKKQVHEQVVELLTAQDSQLFLMQTVNASGEQDEIYPQKIAGEAWKELANDQLMTKDESIGYSSGVGFFHDYVLSNRLGFTPLRSITTNAVMECDSNG